MYWILALIALLAAGPGERAAVVVQTPESPVRLDRAFVLSAPDGPPVLLYSATNAGGGDVDEFTVIAYVFDASGTLKARQTAPARRGLQNNETKYSALVLDGSPVEPTDQVVVGVNAAQKVGSDAWWRGNPQALAEAAAQHKKP